MLDVGTGHGLFGIALAKLAPDTHVTGLDSAGVLEVALENAVLAGVGDRFKCLPGSALNVPFGSGHDTVLFVNFLHHFDRATCLRLLAKAYDALLPGGRVVTLDFIADESRSSPPIAALFSLTMLAVTPSGDTFTFAELERLYADAGFASVKRADLTPTPLRALIGWKAR